MKKLIETLHQDALLFPAMLVVFALAIGLIAALADVFTPVNPAHECAKACNSHMLRQNAAEGCVCEVKP